MKKGGDPAGPAPTPRPPAAPPSSPAPAPLARLAPHIRAFKVGHGRPRSRGDRDELFGGFGASWRGAFVGGDLLIRAVTRGAPGERLPGNFPEYQLMP